MVAITKNSKLLNGLRHFRQLYLKPKSAQILLYKHNY